MRWHCSIEQLFELIRMGESRVDPLCEQIRNEKDCRTELHLSSEREKKSLIFQVVADL